MRFVKITAVILLGVVLFLGIVFVTAGILVPSERTFSQETIIDAPPEIVWNVLTEREKYPEWQKDLKSVKITGEKTWTEETKDAGPIDFKILRSEKPVLLEIEYSMGSWMKGGWSGKLKRLEGGKTLINTTDKTSVKSWPMKIGMSMFFDIEDFARDWNRALKTRAESSYVK
ncbi:MAG: SRPBCC family protein [Pyrinomonadaceae bacterium]